jgi:hypothetical protein
MAEWIGFAVGQPDSLPAAKIQEIIGWCAGPKLILELPDSCTPEILLSYLDVLPVDGLELSSKTLARFESLPQLASLEIILTDEGVVLENRNYHTHNTSPSEAANHIQKINDPSTAFWPHGNLPVAVSLNCSNADNPALKNFDNWNDFLERMDMI